VALFGLIAAASQLVDYGNKTCSWLSDVTYKYRNIHHLQDIQNEANKVLLLATSFKPSLLPSDAVHEHLQDLVSESRALASLVGSICIAPKSSLFGKLNLVTCWRKRQNEIAQRLARIERHKSNLNLCFHMYTSQKTRAIYQALSQKTVS
jgi:hypothetical protein